MLGDRCGCAQTKIALAGDILLRTGSRAYQSIVDHGLDAKNILGPFSEPVSQADIFFYNQSGAITRETTRRDTLYPEHFYLRAEPEAIAFLSSLRAARTVASLANNNTADFGLRGLQETKQLLEAAHIRTVGVGTEEEMTSPVIVETNGLKVGFLAFTDLLPSAYFAQPKQEGVFRLTEENVRRGTRAAKRLADIVVISLHTVANSAAPFRAAPDHAQLRFAYAAADEGAHLVVGHQPHGLQYIERRNGALIFHSLGAFIYNPDTSSLYPKGHPLHFGTQFYGGALLTVSACKHGVRMKRLQTTRCVYEKGALKVVSGTLRQNIDAWSFRVLK